jgi:hypothetical protein
VILETGFVGHEGRDGDSTTVRVHSMTDSSSDHQQCYTRSRDRDLLSHLLDKKYMTRRSDSSFFDRQYLLDFLGVGKNGPGSRGLDRYDDPIRLEDSYHLDNQSLPVSDLDISDGPRKRGDLHQRREA